MVTRKMFLNLILLTALVSLPACGPRQAAPVTYTLPAPIVLTATPVPTFTSTPQIFPTLPPASPTPPPLNRPEHPQLGLNFIRFYFGDGKPTQGLDRSIPRFQPETIFSDFKELNVHIHRQLIKADLLWDVVEPKDNQWNFEAADTVLTNPDAEPIVTLFSLQYASGTPPWEQNPDRFQKKVGAEARNYLETVVRRYAPYVKYWEIGNEMDHWRAANPKDSGFGRARLPQSIPADGYSPREQGVFLAQAASIIRENDPDAVIVMPALSGLDEYPVKTWLGGVLEGSGQSWFDIVNYHYYGPWERYSMQRKDFDKFLAQTSLSGKPVWMTETGSSADPELKQRTNYPNSQESQAADIFRRIVQGWGHGDSLVLWHTYISSKDQDPAGDAWNRYGLRSDPGDPYLSYYAFKLLAQELTPFDRVELLSADAKGVNAYKIVTHVGQAKYVAWGRGKFRVPQGMTQMTSVIPRTNGTIPWQVIAAGREIDLKVEPYLFK